MLSLSCTNVCVFGCAFIVFAHDTLKERSIKEMAELLKALPMQQRMNEKYELHLDIAEQCFGAFAAQHLKVTGRLEQVFLLLQQRTHTNIYFCTHTHKIKNQMSVFSLFSGEKEKERTHIHYTSTDV